ncbi:uncharacterized protein L969DRAFT_96052 [Mixia osmundae IAM 14324]|uniref:Zn(2)-C6 fungal-type domain-containing protein n=1 Tax=Mixia osmundae (strain CBS 9802 / IAM 14324 / JCM 22182 / KY 12970) TaxID=764103 RepID=G7DS64_MIXOS|nr:uncharacterized protein L969DRAFT_96052 [Mixia osmundae IAM 14324]KEI37523.1 hypothetical protein L969DRAFT_96052 [Mixia osmundae IAM 14324]GAA93424.1 hypothetical protein E5Q_00065 [Mixia osmundae IAM 14324]
MIETASSSAPRRVTSRRTCQICRQRKSRCELPDAALDMPPGLLSRELACHRCQILSLSCDLAPESTRKRRRLDAEPEDVTPAKASKVRETLAISRPTRGSESGSVQLRQDDDHGPLDSIQSGDLLVTFDPQFPGPGANMTHEARMMSSTGAHFSNAQPHQVRFHGRSCEAASALLRTAYRRRAAEQDECNLSKLLDAPLIERLRPAYSQLNTFVPYLPPLPSLIERYQSDPSLSQTLLTSVTVYLCALTLSDDAESLLPRQRLAGKVCELRDAVLAQLPKSLHAVQALDLLSLFAPFGCLPGTAAPPGSLGFARGFSITAQSLGTAIELSEKAHAVFARDVTEAWASDELWTWLSVCAGQATVTLEDNDFPAGPSTLNTASSLASTLLLYGQQTLRHEPADAHTDDQTMAKLALCERLARLTEVHGSIGQIYNALVAAVDDEGADPTVAITTILRDATTRFEELDERHGSSLDFTRVERSARSFAGWRAHRRIRQLADIGRVQRVGVISLVGTAFLPDHGPLLTQDDKSTFLLVGQVSRKDKIAYALGRASNPREVINFFWRDPQLPAADAVSELANRRAADLEDLLVEFAALAPSERADGSTVLVPAHHLTAIALDGSGVLMELGAANIAITRSLRRARQDFRSAQRVLMMRTVSITMRSLEANSAASAVRRDTVTALAGVLVGSMARVSEERVRSLEREQRDARIHDNLATTSVTTPPPTSAPSPQAAMVEPIDTSSLPAGSFDSLLPSMPVFDKSPSADHASVDQLMNDTLYPLLDIGAFNFDQPGSGSVEPWLFSFAPDL